MRWIILTLLIANLLYFGWELDRMTRTQVSNASAAMTIPPGAKELTLLSELATPPAPRSAPAPEEMPPPDTGPGELVTQLPGIIVPGPAPGEDAKASCFTFGPLPDEQQAVWLGDWFRSRRIAVNERYTEDPARRLFWVYLSPTGNREAAMAVIDDLQKKGVGDYRLINRGTLENAISLGLFSSQSAVNQRIGELESRGYHPVVVPYSNVQRIYWLDVRVSRPAVMEEMFQGYPARHSSVPVNCDEIAITEVSQ